MEELNQTLFVLVGIPDLSLLCLCNPFNRLCVLDLQVQTYLLAGTGRIPAKATKHIKSLLVTRDLIGNKKWET